MSYIKVQDEPNLVRDSNSSAILETDKSKLQMHRAINAAKKNELNSLKDELNELKKLILTKGKD